MEKLYSQYEKSIAVQTHIIEINRQKLHSAWQNHNFKEVKRLNSLLKVLSEEKYELEEKHLQIRRYLESVALRNLTALNS